MPLTDDYIAMLRRIGEVRPTQAGEVLFREGDRGCGLYVIVSGLLKIADHQDGVERELARAGAREFVGELNQFTGERLISTGVVVEPGEVLVVPVAKLQRLISHDQVLGDLIMRTVLASRDWLTHAGAGLRIVGSRGCVSEHPGSSGCRILGETASV